MFKSTVMQMRLVKGHFSFGLACQRISGPTCSSSTLGQECQHTGFTSTPPDVALISTLQNSCRFERPVRNPKLCLVVDVFHTGVRCASSCSLFSVLWLLSWYGPWSDMHRLPRPSQDRCCGRKKRRPAGILRHRRRYDSDGLIRPHRDFVS